MSRKNCRWPDTKLSPLVVEKQPLCHSQLLIFTMPFQRKSYTGSGCGTVVTSRRKKSLVRIHSLAIFMCNRYCKFSLKFCLDEQTMVGWLQLQFFQVIIVCFFPGKFNPRQMWREPNRKQPGPSFKPHFW